jgi:hypothetical protein
MNARPSSLTLIPVAGTMHRRLPTHAPNAKTIAILSIIAMKCVERQAQNDNRNDASGINIHPQSAPRAKTQRSRTTPKHIQ